MCTSQQAQLAASIDDPDEEFLRTRCPNPFVCPISLSLMNDPCIAADGMTYEREHISRHINAGNTRSPLTNEELQHTTLIPSVTMRSMIQDWREGEGATLLRARDAAS